VPLKFDQLALSAYGNSASLTSNYQVAMAEQAANNEFHSIQVHQFCSMLQTIQGGSGCYNSGTGRLIDPLARYGLLAEF
jgi:hypothetical protein